MDSTINLSLQRAENELVLANIVHRISDNAVMKKELSLKFTGMTGAIIEMDLEEVTIERCYEVDICMVQDTLMLKDGIRE